jgi:hypothetical protein
LQRDLCPNSEEKAILKAKAVKIQTGLNLCRVI